ncbi:MAG TPA: hypothetical protein VG075_17675 [Candidatus Acidoferrum sp.]|jgi:hypothetical protein|nr:hypothetical protein [Candidatus Acidoferrum sp.]
MRRMFLVLLLVSTLPFIGQAQQHGGGAMPAMSGAHAFVAAAPVAVAHAAPVRSAVSARPVVRSAPVSTRLSAAPRAAHPTGWNQHHTTRRNNFSTDPVFPNGGFSADDNPVPGLGFDYPHFFATHPNAGHHRFRHDSGFVIPFIDGGFYLPVPAYADQGSPAPQADDSEAANQPAPPDQTAARDTDSNFRSRMRSEPLPPEQTEYVFVRQDGSLIFAVAYSLINDRLQYVTAEGLRRTIPLNTLDFAATQQFNEQRGVSIRLPA